MRDVVRGGADTWVHFNKPTAKGANSNRLIVDANEPAYSFIEMRSPAPRGSTILSATLRLRQGAQDWTGSHTITVKRVTEDWKVGRTHYNNRPNVTVTGAVAVTKSDTAAATTWDFDVTAHVQIAADGGNHFGWRVESNNNARRGFYSLNASWRKPVLIVEWSDAPAQPTTLRPDGGVISVSHPVVSCDYTDVSGSTEMDAINVQIDAGDDFVSPDFDSGWVLATEPELDLATTAYAGLSAGATTFWRVRVRDAAGLESEWSESATITRQGKGTLTVDNPAADPSDFVEEYTPPILWTHSVTTQTAWQVFIVDAAKPNTRLADSGKTLGTDDSWTVPAGVLVDDRDYIVTVRTWDQYARESTPSDPPYVEASRTFTVAYNAGVTAPTSINATQDADTPGVILTWSRGTAPDSWTIEVDGKAAVVDLDPSDTLVSGTSHSYTYNGAHPGTDHSYMIRAVVNGQMSSGGTPDTLTVTTEGFWVGNDEFGWFVVGGRDIDWQHQETASVHTPLNAQHVVRRVAGMRGLEGSLQGPMRGGQGGLSLDDMRAAVWAAKEAPTEVFRLIAGNVNIPVVIGNVSMRPHQDTKPGRPVEDVSFEFWQKGELPFEAEL